MLRKARLVGAFVEDKVAGTNRPFSVDPR